MARLFFILGVTTLVLAVALGGLRHSVQKMPRAKVVVSEAYPTFMGFGSPKNVDTFSDSVLRIVEHSDHKNGVYGAVAETIVRSKAQGFYKQRPGSPPMHLHTDEDEEFFDVSGLLGYVLDGKVGNTTTGVYVPMGLQHTFWNADPTRDLKVKVRTILKTNRPRKFDAFFETMLGLAQKYGSIGDINPLQLLLTAHETGIEYTFMPYPARIAIRYLAIPLAKLVGFKAFYPEYSSPGQGTGPLIL